MDAVEKHAGERFQQGRYAFRTAKRIPVIIGEASRPPMRRLALNTRARYLSKNPQWTQTA